MLKYIRIFQLELFNQIPRYLFEQVPELAKEAVDRIYQFAPVLMKSGTIYGGFDEDNKIKGVLWVGVDLIEATMWVKLLSVNREHRGNATKEATDFLLTEVGVSIEKLGCLQKHPEFAKAAGWTEGKRTYLTYEVNDDNANRPDENEEDNKERKSLSGTTEPTE